MYVRQMINCLVSSPGMLCAGVQRVWRWSVITIAC